MTQQQEKTKEPDRHRPVLTPPREKKPHQATSPLVAVSIIGGFLTLLLLGVIVLYLLPAKVKNIQLPDQSAQQTLQPAVPLETVPQTSGKREAERLLGEWLKRQAVAEPENVSVWGGKEYADILKSVAQADQLFQDSAFGDAQKGYQQAIDDLDTLVAEKNDRLTNALERGQLAIEQQESTAAINAFELALAINPDHDEALRGAERARNFAQVLGLYKKSLNLEEQKKLKQARLLMQQAVNIDPEFTPAAEGLRRLQISLRDLRFQDTMSRALSALDQGDLPTADQAITQALQEKPDAPAAKAAAQRVEEMKKGARLQELRRKADSLVGDEKWGDALKLYSKALQIDPQVGFGVIGLPEAKKRQRLDEAIKATLLQPERLQDNGPLNDAQQLLKRAKTVTAPGPVLREQIDRLNKLIVTAATPVAVTLRSDNATVVEIYHVGRFSPFYEKRLDLRPGSYIIVGKRPGYKDVRMTLKIEAGKDMPVFVFIRGEEPI